MIDLFDLQEFEPERYALVKTIIDMRKLGYTTMQIGAAVNLCERQVYRILAELKLSKKMDGYT